jgi:hypothetical protein
MLLLAVQNIGALNCAESLQDSMYNCFRLLINATTEGEKTRLKMEAP